MVSGYLRLLVALCVAMGVTAKNIHVTVPIKKDGETYALLDFHQSDAEYVVSTSRQFCIDHGFDDSALRSIVEHTLAQINKLEGEIQKQEDTNQLGATPLQLADNAAQLLKFMTSHSMNAADVLKSVAQLLENGQTK